MTQAEEHDEEVRVDGFLEIHPISPPASSNHVNSEEEDTPASLSNSEQVLGVDESHVASATRTNFMKPSETIDMVKPPIVHSQDVEEKSLSEGEIRSEMEPRARRVKEGF